MASLNNEYTRGYVGFGMGQVCPTDDTQKRGWLDAQSVAASIKGEGTDCEPRPFEPPAEVLDAIVKLTLSTKMTRRGYAGNPDNVDCMSDIHRQRGTVQGIGRKLESLECSTRVECVKQQIGFTPKTLIRMALRK